MIYIDSDGVLADFDKWVVETDHSILASYKKGQFNEEIYKLLVEHAESAYRDFQEVEENSYLFQYIRERDDVRVLTALPSPRHVFNLGVSVEEFQYIQFIWRMNKLNWFGVRGVPSDKVIILSQSSLKANWCKSKEDILIDDFERNCREWNAAGGFAIKTHNRWYDSSFLATI